MAYEEDISRSRDYRAAEFQARPLTEIGQQVVGEAEDILQEASRTRQRQMAAKVFNFLKDCGPSIAMHTSFGMFSYGYKAASRKK